MSFALAIDNLTCIRGARVVFSAVGLKAPAGAIIAVEGPNGAGKTSLLRIIAGLLPPASGTVTVHHGDAQVSDPEERAALTGWLGHQDAVKPQMSVREQLLFWARLYGTGRDPDEVLKAFGLARLAGLPGQFLSAGQRRRLALARLTLLQRPLWLLDEPLAALDADGKALVQRVLKDHCAQGGIALAATHEPLGLDGETLRLGGA